jgi:hypothetical protein
MGDRAIIVVTDGQYYGSAAVYMHSRGEYAPKYLRDAISRMRRGDVDYSLARLIGELHNRISGNTGLGVIQPPRLKDIQNSFENYSQGDAGVIVYNCTNGHTQYFQGYLAEENPGVRQNEIPPLDFR